MGKGFALRLFLIAYILFLPNLLHAATEKPLSKSDYCVKFLTLEKPAVSLRVPNVDWTQFRKNLSDMGYPVHIINEKQRSIHFDETDALAHFRDQMEKPNWKWGDPLSDSDYEKIADDDLVERLGFLALIPGFDAAKFVNALFRGRQSNFYGYSGYDDSEAKPFLWWSHLWLKGPLALRNAEALFEKDKSAGAAGWLLKWLEGEDRAKFGKTVMAALEKAFKTGDFARNHDEAQFLLQVVTHIPGEFRPANIKRAIDEEWLSIKRFRPIKLPAVKSCLFGYEHAGNCQYMTSGHIKSLGLGGRGREGDDWKNSVIIRVRGKVVGSLKLTGDPSMIALRNVTDEQGNLVLVIGGVYFLPKDLVEKLRNLTAGKENRWRGADLAELNVTPSTFLLNSNSWSDLNFADLIRISKNRLTKDELITFMESFHENVELNDPELGAKTWPELLIKLNNVRRLLESN